MPTVSPPAVASKQLLADLLAWKSELERSRQRDIVVLEGSLGFMDSLFESLLGALPEYLVFSNRFDAATPCRQAGSCLGQEASWVILDLSDGFDTDAFCIAAGLVNAGGILLLLWPGDALQVNRQSERYAVWQDGKRSSFPWFEQQLFESLKKADRPGSWITESAGLCRPPSAGPVLQPTPIVDGCTEDQQRFLSEAKQWLQTGQPGVFLLLADRGRGKSTALGMLCDDLQQSARHTLVVTAASRQAAALCLQRAPAARFIAPDVLLQSVPEAGLVVVDESAMIPQSILRQICLRYAQVILATTTGGYEGTGQGFLLRFRASFPESRRQECQLHAPVRWCAGDQLESWLNETLMPMTDDEPIPPAIDAELSSISFRLLRAGEEMALVKQAYSLLSHAHYRTAPADLQMMMENPDLRLLVAIHENRLIAAVLLNREGGLESDLCEAVFLGQRRPRGHLLAQMITVQTGARDFATRRGLRVQRIAVATHCRRRGIGTALIKQARRLAEAENLDYLGASFALDSGAVAFWSGNDFIPACLSYAQGKSTGSHSLAVIQPLADDLRAVCRRFVSKMHRQLPLLMLSSLQSMEADHVVAVLRYVKFAASVDELEENDMTAFIVGERGLESCFVSVQKQVMQAIASTTDPVEDLLVYKAVLHRDWSALPRQSGSEGRRQLQQRLRHQVEALIKDC